MSFFDQIHCRARTPLTTGGGTIVWALLEKKNTQQDSLDPDFIKNVKVNKPASIARQIAVFAVKRRILSIIILQRDSDE